MRFTQIMVPTYSLLLAALGVGFWTAPDILARRFNLEPLGAIGFAELQADTGGLLLTIGALGLFGVVTHRRLALAAAILLLAGMVAGRLTGWAVTGELAGLRVSLPLETGALVAMTLHAARLKPWTTVPVKIFGKF